MKKRLFFILMNVAMIWLCVASDNSTDKWGAESCGVQMSLQLVLPVKQVQTNQQINLSIKIKNVSTGVITFVETGVSRDYYFTITSPSGKDLSTKEPTINTNSIESRSSEQLKPGESCELQFDLRSICNLTEIGAYKIIAKRNMPFPYRHDCVVVSNPLSVMVVPGQ